jgi:hypothetical protein
MEIKQQKHYAALASILTLMGMFIHPAAAIIIPFVLFIFYNWRQMSFARLVALRAADLAFSLQLYLIIASALLAAVSWMKPMTEDDLQNINTIITLSAVAYMMISLIISAIQAFRCKAFEHILSLKIAERLLGKNDLS